MRIITGLYKGRAIRTVDDLSVRPATDRVKKTIFDMLAVRLDFDGATVLDLFAGSGSLGFEALSRGAARAVFVEANPEAAGFIEENAQNFGCERFTEIRERDAVSFVQHTKEAFDLVFADPPYRFDRTKELPGMIFEAGLVKKGGLLVIEHDPKVHFESTRVFAAGPEKKFGRTVVTFFQHPQQGLQ